MMFLTSFGDELIKLAGDPTPSFFENVKMVGKDILKAETAASKWVDTNKYTKAISMSDPASPWRKKTIAKAKGMAPGSSGSKPSPTKPAKPDWGQMAARATKKFTANAPEYTTEMSTAIIEKTKRKRRKPKPKPKVKAPTAGLSTPTPKKFTRQESNTFKGYNTRAQMRQRATGTKGQSAFE